MASVGEVFALIRAKGELTRTEITALTGLSRTAVGARLAILLSAGLVKECQPAPSTGGRPATQLSVDTDAGIVLSVAVGLSRTRLAVCDLAGAVLALSDIDSEVALGPADLMPDIGKGLDVLLEQFPGVDVHGVGLTLPGTVDADRGCSCGSAILRGWDGVPLRPYLEAVPRIGSAPIVLDNDANAIALAERGGDDDVLVVKASSGLGAGIIAGGVLLRGANQAAGEFGHNKVVAAEGIPCRCGNTGCLEAVAAGWAIVRALQQQGVSVRHLRDVAELAADGDPEARRMVRESGRAVGAGIAPAVNLLNPAAVVIAGDMAEVYEMFVAGLRESLYGNATAEATGALQVRPAAHGDRSATVGTAMLVLEHVLSVAAIDARF
ncbi:ROK family protein [Mycolicibacterium sp. A43C]